MEPTLIFLLERLVIGERWGKSTWRRKGEQVRGKWIWTGWGGD
jgi:hypothetical protein